MTPVSAPPEQHAGVAALSQMFGHSTHTRQREAPQYELVGPSGERSSLPASVFHVFKYVVEVMARGDAVTIAPVGKELTTQQAADLLNVSRQYLVRLLNEGRIPYTKTGKHRRLRIEDVLAFKEQRDEEREKQLDELTRLSEELGGYSELK